MEIASVEEMTGELPSIQEAMEAIMGQGAANRSAAPIPARLFVGSLSLSTTSEDLLAAFSKFGPVEEAVVITDPGTDASRGFGFVTMKNRKDAPGAIAEMHDSVLDGRAIVVRTATERRR